MALFHIFRSSGISRYFQVLLFCLSEGFKLSEGCFIIFRYTVSQFLYARSKNGTYYVTGYGVRLSVRKLFHFRLTPPTVYI